MEFRYLLWTNIRKLAYNDLQRGTKKIPKLKLDLVDSNSYSSMKVNLATQVLSSSVGGILRKDYPGNNATATFCEMLVRFFDCLNVRSQHEGKRGRNEFKMAYYIILPYLDLWKKETDTCPGNFSSSECEKMFLS